MNEFLKNVRYGLEAVFLIALLGVFKCLPAQKASNFGGWLGRTIGPKLAASRKAKRNIQRAMPECSEEETEDIIIGMWDNLGRVIAEYPHLETLSKTTKIIGMERLQNALDHENGAIFYSSHAANWEINATAILTQAGKAIDLSYRAPNNPWSDRLLMKARTLNGKIPAHPKSRSGGRKMIDALKNAGYLGILIDQKYNEGINVPFFGIEAMTNPFFVQLAQKYRCPLIPVQNKRVNGAHFELTFHEPLPVFDDNNEPRPIEDVVKDAHLLLERFIREAPEQWLWLHRRWKD